MLAGTLAASWYRRDGTLYTAIGDSDAVAFGHVVVLAELDGSRCGAVTTVMLALSTRWEGKLWSP